MRLDQALSQAEVLDQLTRETEAVWGTERLAALAPTLTMIAGALWALAQRGPEVAGEEPDFIKDPATGEWSGFYPDWGRQIADLLIQVDGLGPLAGCYPLAVRLLDALLSQRTPLPLPP